MASKLSDAPLRVRKTLRPEKAIGSLIREMRLEKGWSQEDLAAAADIDRTYVSLLERFQRDPSLSVVMQLARALGIAPDIFMEKIAARMDT
jgi:transcriptional regulator with XRE-family HTH domain